MTYLSRRVAKGFTKNVFNKNSLLPANFIGHRKIWKEVPSWSSLIHIDSWVEVTDNKPAMTVSRACLISTESQAAFWQKWRWCIVHTRNTEVSPQYMKFLSSYIHKEIAISPIIVHNLRWEALRVYLFWLFRRALGSISSKNQSAKRQW